MQIPVEVVDDTECHGVATDFIFDTILDTTSLYTGYQVLYMKIKIIYLILDIATNSIIMMIVLFCMY